MRVLGVVLALSLMVVVAGPRARLDPDVPAFTLGPGAVDAYLSAREARLPDLTAGVEKQVRWADETGAARDVAVVYLHGFSATHPETAPLARDVADSLGANLVLTRLAGHGRGGEAMGEVTAEDWLHDVTEALAVADRIAERTVVIGTSTGGTLALWAASRPEFEGQIAAAAVISANFGPKDARSEVLLWPWGGVLARLVQGPTRRWDPLNAEQARFWTTEYPTRALLPMMALVHMAREIDPEALGAPVLNLYSPHDRVVSTEKLLAWSARAPRGRWRSVVVEGSGDPDQHVLAGDILSPSTTAVVRDHMVDFFRAALRGELPRRDS